MPIWVASEPMDILDNMFKFLKMALLEHSINFVNNQYAQAWEIFQVLFALRCKINLPLSYSMWNFQKTVCFSAHNRPGVATTMSGLDRRSRYCLCSLIPPTMAIVCIGLGCWSIFADNCLKTSFICMANSRVGAITSAKSEISFFDKFCLPFANHLSIIGIAKASVFPLPLKYNQINYIFIIVCLPFQLRQLHLSYVELPGELRHIVLVWGKQNCTIKFSISIILKIPKHTRWIWELPQFSQMKLSHPSFEFENY